MPLAIFFAAVSFFVWTFSASASASVVINEIAWMGTKSSSADEWIELYNTGDAEIALDGWSLQESDGTIIIALTGSIAAKSFYLIERTDDSSVAGVTADIARSWSGYGLSNSGEKISLADDTGRIIDQVDCLSGWFAGIASPEYKTMEKINPNIGSGPENWSTNNGSLTIGSDAAGSTIQGTPKSQNSVYSLIPLIAPTPTPTLIPTDEPTPTPTPSSALSPTPENTPSPQPSTVATIPTPSQTPIQSASPSATPTPIPQYSKNIFINEFMPHPPQGQSEWVELYNSGNETINLNGWQIDDSNSNSRPHVISQDTQIGPLGLIVINLSKALLNNDDDEVRLLWPDDQILHNIVYDSAKQGYSVARLSDGRWVWTDQPSPGQKNPAIAVETKNSKMPSPSPSPTSAPNFLAAQISLPSDSPLPIISTLQEQVASLADASQKNNPQNTNRQTAAPTNNAPSTENSVGGPQTNEDQLTNNLTAAAQNEIKNSNTSALVWLAAVLILSAAAALGLLYFKRRQVPTVAVDKKKTKF